MRGSSSSVPAVPSSSRRRRRGATAARNSNTCDFNADADEGFISVPATTAHEEEQQQPRMRTAAAATTSKSRSVSKAGKSSKSSRPAAVASSSSSSASSGLAPSASSSANTAAAAMQAEGIGIDGGGVAADKEEMQSSGKSRVRKKKSGGENGSNRNQGDSDGNGGGSSRSTGTTGSGSSRNTSAAEHKMGKQRQGQSNNDGNATADAAGSNANGRGRKTHRHQVGHDDEVCADAKSIERALREADERTGGSSGSGGGYFSSSASLLKVISRASAAAAESAFGGTATIGYGCGTKGKQRQQQQPPPPPPPQVEGVLLLEEKVGDVLSVVKKCLRAATSASTSSSTGSTSKGKTPKKKKSEEGSQLTSDAKVAHLRLAVHCLRAVCPLVAQTLVSSNTSGRGGRSLGKREDQLVENAIRLLYHAIVASEDVFVDASSSSSSSDGRDMRMDAASLCLTSCSVLSHLLTGLGMSCRGELNDGNTTNGTIVPSSLLVVMMNVPTDQLGKIGPMTAVQIAKIGAQSLLSACTVLSSSFVDSVVQCHVRESSDKDQHNLAREFGFSLLGANAMGRSTTCPFPVPSFQLLIRSAVLKWLRVFVDDASKDGSDCALSYSKRYQRLLWESAARLEKKAMLSSARSRKEKGGGGDVIDGTNESHLRRLILGLRGDSILASLVWAVTKATASVDLRNAILEERLAYACECAWKSATTYSQGVVAASSLDPTWYGSLGRSVGQDIADDVEADPNALTEFHNRIGATLDELIKARLDARPKECDKTSLLPFSYLEYCANRAMHVGPNHRVFGQEVIDGHDDKENSTSSGGTQYDGRSGCDLGCTAGGSSCSQDDCVYSNLPFAFFHDRALHGLSNERKSEEEEALLCGFTTLGVVFAALQASNLVYSRKLSCETARQLDDDDRIILPFKTLLLSSTNGRRNKLSVVVRCQKMLAPLKLSSRATQVGKIMRTDDNCIESIAVAAASLVHRILGECYAPLLSLLASVEEEKSPSLVSSSSIKVSRLEMAQDGFIRAAMLADRLDVLALRQDGNCDVQSNDVNSFKTSADLALLRVYKLALGSSDENAVMVAKSIGAVGKQRIERQDMKGALVPMLLSTEIFASLFESSCSSSYKLPARFGQLSNLFESADMPDEAIVALGFAIHYKLREALEVDETHTPSESSSISRIILRSVEIVGGGEGPFSMLSPSDGSANTSAIASSQFFSRLMRLYVKYYRDGPCGDYPKSSTCATLADAVKRSRVGKTLERALSLESCERNQAPLPVYRIFQLLVTRSGVKGLEAVAQVTFLNKALYMFGGVLAAEVANAQTGGSCSDIGSKDSNEKVKEWISNQLSAEFTGFLKLALTCASKGRGECISESLYRQYESSVYLSASASFYVNRIDPDVLEVVDNDSELPNLLRSAIKYAEKAKSLLQKASQENGDDQDLLLLVQQLAVDYYLEEVLRAAKPEAVLESSSYKDQVETAEGIVHVIDRCNDCPDLVDIRSCLAFVLARINSELQLLGDSTFAIRTAALLARLQQSDNTSLTSLSSNQAPMPADQALEISNLASALLEGGFHGACRGLLQGFLSRHYHDGRLDDFNGTLAAATSAIFARKDVSINEVDLLASALLVQVQSSAPDYLEVCLQTLHDIAGILRDHEDSDDASSWLHVRWILSTCQIGVAQQMEKTGDVPRSLDAYRDCSRSCRSAISFFRSPSGQCAAANLDSNTILHPCNMMHRFSVRLFQCLRDASSLYCRQGNYNKGEGYALSLVEAMSALPNSSTTASKKGTDDLINLLEASSVAASVRRADALQFFVEIQALSRDAVMVSSNFEKRGTNPASFVDDDLPEKALQNVRSTMSYGDIVARGTERDGLPSFLAYHNESYSKLLQISSEDFFDEGCIPIMFDDDAIEMDQFENLMSESRLRQANGREVDTKSTPNCETKGDVTGDTTTSSPSSLYRLVSESGYSSGLTRAKSYYHIGLEFLAEARRNGELHQLWAHSATGGKDALAGTNDSNAQPLSAMERARESFAKAAALAGPASTLLSRQVMRCLALATGPDNITSGEADIGYTASVLVHSSVGSTQRLKVAQAFASTAQVPVESDDFKTMGTRKRQRALFEALDTALNDRSSRNSAIQSMYDEACLVLPADWRFVALATCPTGELLVSAFYFRGVDGDQRALASEIICIFPGNEKLDNDSFSSSPSPSSVYEGILKPFDDVMERSRFQLKDMDSASLDRFSENEKKRIWWEEREAIDRQLQKVIEEIEAKYFNSNKLQRLLLGSQEVAQQDDSGDDYVATMCQGFDGSDEEEELECSLGNLADKFEAACAVTDEDVEDEEDDTVDSAPAPEKMTVAQIKEELQSRGVDKSEFKQMRKAALVELLQNQRQIVQRAETSTTAKSRRESSRRKSTVSSLAVDGGPLSTCTFLILDEELQRLPFEAFKSMEDLSICRVPSISFAIATLLERGHSRIQAANAKYVLDPEANLSSTKRTMLSALDSLTSTFNWTWEGVVGEIPSTDFMESALTSENGLFLYCGHGCGEKCFSRKQVEGLLVPSGRSGTDGAWNVDDSDGQREQKLLRRCSSTLLLMGCSSGRLVSVNGSRTSPPKNLALEYEPEGMALSYLCAGAPCVVGNLWDVTDRDIDRFCLALLEDFLNPSGKPASKSLPQCVARARSVCKMRHIVGAAPVVYGVPVLAEQLQNSGL